MTLIFESLDAIKFIIAGIEETGEEPAGEDTELIEKLAAVYEGRPIDGGAGEASEGAEAVEESKEAIAEDSTSGETVEDAPKDRDIGKTLEAVLDVLPDAPAAPAENVEEKKPEAKKEVKKADASPAAKGKEPAISTQTLRVNVDVLENLMTMVSELVLTRNQLMQIMRNQRESEFSGPLQNLNQVVSELQDGVMKTRMQPIGNAWAKLPRIIRDITLDLGKKIDLEMIGQETELDRQVLEMIKDPLTHMVRNSADHGIEAPADRVKVGKPETGKILLNAYHEGGHIIIEIKDDGKGLAIDKITQKILDNGLATQEELDKMSSHQIQQYIFKAGFSTAEKVTSVSGRGVGMDVVRSNIENIGGSIELNSVEGKGTTFFIKIPLTLAIISALIVEAAGERFAVPQLAVRELVMATENGQSRIEMIKGTPVFRLRDHLLPLVSLHELLSLEAKAKELLDKSKSSLAEVQAAEGQDGGEASDGGEVGDATASTEDSGDNVIDFKPGAEPKDEKIGSLKSFSTLSDDEGEGNQIDSDYIIVTQVGSYQFGIIVDQVYDTEEIVVKPVSNILRDIDLFSGNTILGDGSVIMILDPAGIAKTTGDIEGSEKGEQKAEALSAERFQDSKTSLLLFNAGGQTPKAVPLALVARLENIYTENIEYADNQMLVQYRGKLMPLIPMNSDVSVKDQKEKPVLVFSTDDKSMGLIVDEILDILEAHIDVQYSSGQQGIIGSAIINDKATDIIDVGHYVQKSDKDWFRGEKEGESFEKKQAVGGGKRRILLVDDSPFFRNMMAPLLSVAGYDVTPQESATEALKLLERGEVFDVIVSDIEMPDMSGFEFAEKIRNNDEFKKTPLVALSAHATTDDIHRGEQAGFHKYVAKFDRDSLISTINETIGVVGDDDGLAEAAG